MLNTPENKSIKAYSLLNPDVLANPFSLYREIRQEDPIHFVQAGQFWITTRYDDAVQLLRDPRISSDRKAHMALQLGNLDFSIIKDFLFAVDNMMVMKDPPEHTRIRKVANQGFTQQALVGWTSIIEQVVNQLLDKVQPTGKMDIVADFAQQLPAKVIAQIFGISKEDEANFQQWSDDVVKFFGGSLGNDIVKDATLANEGMAGLLKTFKKIIAEREKEPGTDMVSLLIGGYEAGKFSRDELACMCIMILIAGHVTTIDQLSNGIYLFLKHPEQWQLLRSQPQLVKSAVEEILRYDSSLPFTFRVAKEDIDIRGKRINKGQVVAVGLSAANHDPAEFSAPELFDITRSPNKHIAFAFGPHFCLGAVLARMELSMAIEGLLKRIPEIRFDPSSPAQIKCESLMFKGYHRLPVVF